ncbi:MAG: hypothetical protein Q8R92_08690 [Deltaproteobacteria bacterium]|nr:hypothetical protein [Deltaproteobacteria bacterium]
MPLSVGDLYIALLIGLAGPFIPLFVLLKVIWILIAVHSDKVIWKGRR